MYDIRKVLFTYSLQPQIQNRNSKRCLCNTDTIEKKYTMKTQVTQHLYLKKKNKDKTKRKQD